MLIAEAQQVKAKLELKGRWRPEKMVRKKMPDGAGMLAKVPQRSESSRGADEAAALAVDKKYCDAIDQVSAVFGRQKRSNSTADEHKGVRSQGSTGGAGERRAAPKLMLGTSRRDGARWW